MNRTATAGHDSAGAYRVIGRAIGQEDDTGPIVLHRIHTFSHAKLRPAGGVPPDRPQTAHTIHEELELGAR